MPSSSPQNSGEPSVLLKILAALSSFVLFGRLLSKLRTPYHDSSRSSHPQKYTEESTQVAQKFTSPIEVEVRSFPPTPPEREAAEKRQDTRDEERLSIEKWTLLALSVYTVVTVGMWWASNKAANAAKDAAGIASAALVDTKNSFEVQNRPYVIPDGTAYFLKTTEGKPALNLANVNYKNVGKTPAQEVYIVAHFELFRFEHEQKTQEDLIAIDNKVFEPYIKQDILIATSPEIYAKLDKWDIAPGAPDAFITRNLLGIEKGVSFDKWRQDLVKGDIILHFSGRIYYKAFEKTRSYTTDFCFYFFGGDTSTWHYCVTHNLVK